MDDYLREFVQESEENITELNNALLELERRPDDEETMDRVFRMAHTLKGNCGAMGFDEASDVAHAIEDRLEDLRAGRLEVNPELMDEIFAGVDALEQAVQETRQRGEPTSDFTEEITALRSLGPGDGDLVPPSGDEIDEAIDEAAAPEPEHAVYHVRLNVEEAEGLNNAVLVVEALEDAFDLLGTVPGESDLRAGEHDSVVDAVFGSAVEEHAIEAALDPVDEVEGAIITDVTDRTNVAATADDGAQSVDELVSGSDVDASEAEDMEVDELLSEFDEYDDLDALVEQMDGADDIGELGEAGSFDDLDIDADDIDAPDPLAEAEEPATAGGDDFDLESGGGAFGDEEATVETGSAEADATADAESAAEPADDEEVEDAAETFAELKDEVEPVGFDELQDELDELEFDQYDQEEEVGFDELLTEEELEGEEFGGMATADEEAIDEAIDDILVDDAGVADHESPPSSTSEASDAAPAESGDAAEAEPPGFEDAGEGVTADAGAVSFDDDEAGEEITFGDDEAEADAAADADATAEADAPQAPADGESVDFGEFASGGETEAETDATADADAVQEDTFAAEVFPSEEPAQAEAEPAEAETEPAEAETEPAAADAEPAVTPGDDPTAAVEPAPAAADAEPAEADAEPAVTPAEDPTPAVEPAPAAGGEAEPAEADTEPAEAEPEPAVTPSDDPEPAVVPASEPAQEPEPAEETEPVVVPGDDPTPAVEPLSTEPTAGDADAPSTSADVEGAAAGAAAEAAESDGPTASADADGPTASADASDVDVDVDVGVEADAGDGFGDDDLDVAFADDGETATAGADDDFAADAEAEPDDFAADDGLTADAGGFDVDDDVGDVGDAGLEVGGDDVDLGDDDLDVSFADDAATAESADAPGAAGADAAEAGGFGDFDDDVGPEFEEDPVDAEFDEEFGSDIEDLDDAAFGDGDDEGFDEIRFADADAEADASGADAATPDAETDTTTADVGAGASDVDVGEFDADEIAGTGLDEGALGDRGVDVDEDALDLGPGSRMSGFESELGRSADAADFEAEPEPTGPELPDRDVDLDGLLPTPPRAAAAEGDDDEMASIRVDIDRLDDLMNLVEGLVTQRARLRRAVETGESLATIDQELDDVEELTGELQDTVMDIRLVPLRSAANRLPRVVRDVAREQGKQVEFEMFGEDVELDRSVLDDIDDPLMHAVRNAVDHGIELPEDREAAGKDPTGHVELRAERERDTIVIEVEDDGSGLDPDELREKAVEEGIISQAEADGMDDEMAHKLVFEPGFSTAEEVTDVSGRGVGMDVVASTVQELDGEVEIESEPGEGTTVRMRLPVSVAISDVLFVEAGGEEYGIPLKTVEEIERMGAVEEDEDGGEHLVVGEDRYELVRLAQRLDAPEAGPETDGMVVRIRTGVRQIAVHCDEVRGQQEVVVKPFEGVLGDVPGLTGAAVLGEGEVVNILDVNTL